MSSSKRVIKRSNQAGFTLLELLVAMAIFAMMAVAGWQVFDGLSRSQERTEGQTDILEQVQYAHQQVSRDMMQVVAYHAPSSVQPNRESINTNAEDNSDNSSISSGFVLSDNTLTLIRHSDPDPRYKMVNQLERVQYVFQNDALIRRRYRSLNGQSDEVPVESMLLSGVTEGHWQVLLPAPSDIFPTNTNSLDDNFSNSSATATVKSQSDLLPKGVSVSFGMKLGEEVLPITWQFALSGSPPTISVTTAQPETGNQDADEAQNPNNGEQNPNNTTENKETVFQPNTNP